MGALAALAAALTWSMASLLFEKFGRSAGGIALNLIKCAVALGLMMPTLLLLEGSLWPTDLTMRELGILGTSGLVGLSVGDTFWFMCLLRLGARRALLLFTIAPPMTAALGAVVLDEPFSAAMVGGMIVTLAGVAWVIAERTEQVEGADDTNADGLGLVFGIAAAACQAVGSVLTKFAGVEHSALDVSIVRLAAATLGLLVIAAASGRLGRVRAPFATRRSGFAVLGATVLGTYLGIWFMNAGFLLTRVGVAATLNAMSPIFVLPLAALFLGEKLSPRSVLGALVAVGGVALLFVTANAGA